MIKTASAAAFLAAWQRLCAETPTPHYRTAFQHLSSDILPKLLVLEVMPEHKYIVRFMGTVRAQIWGQELTGKDSLAMMPPHVIASAKLNLATMSAHPCGMYHVFHLNTPTGREMMMEHITVPVANDPDHPRRLINFAEEISTVAYGVSQGEIHNVTGREWIDVGAGVPAKAPVK